MKSGRYKISIELKITAFVCAAVLIFFVAVMRLGYVALADSLLDTAGTAYVKTADALSASIASIINREIEVLDVITGDSPVKTAITASNEAYRKNESDSQRYLMDMDKKWIESPDDHPLVKEYLDNDASRSLKSTIRKGEGLIEILVTDRAGGLVASSVRVRDFYQANKNWWQEAFNAGKGKALVKDIAFNETLNVWVIPFVVPVKDADGEVTGICRALVDIQVFFGPLKNFRIRKTGTAVLVDDNSYLIFQYDTKPFAYKFCESGKLQKALENKRRWSVMDGVYLYSGGVLTAYSPVNNPLFLEKGINWRVFIVQGSKEVLAPLGAFVLQIILVTVFLMILVLVALKVILKGLFTEPMRKLREGIERIGKGDLDYKVGIKSTDEIGQLADSFNAMAGNLKISVSPIAVLNAEINERKKIETELVRTMEEWQRVFNAFTDIIFITDANFNILKVNSAFLGAIGSLRAEDVIGKKCFEMFHGANKMFPKCPINHTALKNKSLHTEEMYDANTGKATLLAVMPIFNEHEQLVLIVHIVKDISDIKKAKQDITLKDDTIKRLEKLRTDFLYIASQCQSMLSADEHEIKSMLHSASNIMNDRQKKTISGAITDMARLTKSIDNLLEISRIEQGEANFKMEPTDLRSIIKKIVFDFEPRIRAKGLGLKLAIGPDKVIVYADANRINQVFVNLLENAIRFTEKGSIELGVTEFSDNIECIIYDTGIGITQDDLSKVFDRFQQINPAQPDTEERGLGLGLALVKAIIERHDGKIRAESELGKGSKFTFTMPKYKKEALNTV